MFINVRAHNEPWPGRGRAGRYFPNGAVTRMEVVELDDPKLDADTNQPTDKDGRPDMARITRAGMAEIKSDPIMSLLADEETQGTVGQAQVDAARAEVADLSRQLMDAKIRIAELEAQAAETADTGTGNGGKGKAKKTAGDDGK
jgi:hypothetical protein